MKSKIYILGLGGSLIWKNNNLNTSFLRKFFLFLRNQIKNKKKFIVVSGGGNLAREFQVSLNKIGKFSNKDKDLVGILATKINAHFLKTIFKKYAKEEILDSEKKVKLIKTNRNFKLVFASGWRPGFSTDYVAVKIADILKFKKVIFLTDVDYLYNKNPRIYKNAKPIKNITYKDYFKLIPKKWSPGLKLPVGPVAAELAMAKRIEIILTCPKELDNLKNILENKKYKGTKFFCSK